MRAGGLFCLLALTLGVGARANDSLGEWITLQEKIQRAVGCVRAELRDEGLRLGMGWWGNVSRLGPHCDDVAYRVQAALHEELDRTPLRHYGIVLLFDAGPVPGDFLAHVYFGVVRKGSDRPLYCFDPWRYGDGRLRDACGRSPDDVIPVL